MTARPPVELNARRKPCSDETKAKISAALAGRVNGPPSDETRGKISRALTGKVRSAETRAKVSASWTDKRRSEHSARTCGRIVTEEARANMAAVWTDEKRDDFSSRSRGRLRLNDLAAGFYIDQSGYKILTGQQHHPLATRNGAVGEHCKVLYEAIGPDHPECHWCGKQLVWRGPRSVVVCADHLDDNKINNDLANLVPSCIKCNWDRGK